LPIPPISAAPKRIDDAASALHRDRQSHVPARLTLKGMRVVVDCANGAAYKVAPEALFELGAEVIKIGVEPNGFNINRGGRLHRYARFAGQAVLETRADLGIALDGDADRVVIVDEKGNPSMAIS
jgi:phosphoglucosamine mutase